MRIYYPIFALICFVAFVSSTLTPAHVVLTLNGNVSCFQVTFSSSTKPTSPSVTFWPADDSSKQIEVVASSSEITTFTHPVTKAVEYITSLTMAPMMQDTEYSYYVSGQSKDNTTNSDTFKFYTLPDEESVINIGIYGDMGAYGSALIEKGTGGLPYWTARHSFDFIIHNGDLAYNLDSNNGDTGMEFMSNVEVLTATTPYVVTPGNHEFMGYSETYYNTWFLGQQSLGKQSGSTDPIMYYSFDIGSKLHIVVISTEVYCEDHDSLIPQYEWLQKDLASVRARSVQPWILAFGHRQIYIGSSSSLHSRLMRLGLQCNDTTLRYCDYTKPCTTGKNCGYSIEKLYAEYKVDMYFAGHVHTYNRMYPISDDLTYETQDASQYINPQHPVYVVSGAAGTQSEPPFFFKSDADTSPTVTSVGGYSFSLVNVYNSTHLELRQNDVDTAKIVDSFWIVKDPSKGPWTKTTTLTIAPDSETVCDQ